MIVISRSVLYGVAMITLGTGPWAVLIALNLKYGFDIPWAVPITLIYLWFYWKFATGKSWPTSTGESRRNFSRTNKVDGEVIGLAIGAGFIALWALVQFQSVYSRMVHIPAGTSEDYSTVPMLTLVPSLIMSAIVAGVTEEISMRGYLQGPIERKYGPVIAIAITSIIFGFLHFTHREVTLILMPWYVGVGIIYGSMAYLTNSTLPGIFLHAGGNMLNAVSFLGLGKTEWQTSKQPLALVWESGTDASFWLSLVAFLLLTVFAIIAFRQLSRVSREVHAL